MGPSSRNTTGTREGYDRWAAVYDGEGNPLVALEEARVAELIGCTPAGVGARADAGGISRHPFGDARGLRVIDVGCGTGRHAVRLAAAGADVTAVDFSEGMLAQAKSKPGAERVRFVVHDVTTPLPFADRAFDWAIACLVADHVPELSAFLSELGRVAPRVVLTTIHPAMHLRGVQARFTDPVTLEKVEVASHLHAISDYVTAALRAGLSIDAMEEHSPDLALAERFPRAEKYVGWPLLLAMRFHALHRR